MGKFSQILDFTFLLWDNSGVDDSGCDCGEKDNWVLDCDPLSRWEPNDLSVGLLA